MRSRFAILLLCLPLPLGCATNNATVSPGTTELTLEEAGPDAAWPYWPAGMRVHPLTRIVHDVETDERILEARLEFTDRDGFTSRAFGFTRIELFDGEPSFGREPVIGWSIDLRNLQRNATHFDDVSRMYLMRLELTDVSVPTNVVLTVEFYSLNGTDMRSVHRLRR